MLKAHTDLHDCATTHPGPQASLWPGPLAKRSGPGVGVCRELPSAPCCPTESGVQARGLKVMHTGLGNACQHATDLLSIRASW